MREVGRRESFPRSARLRRRADFVSVQNQGAKFHGRHFIVLVGAGGAQASRVGITVSGKVGNAVVRNRIKRLVREFVRRHAAWVPAGADLVVVAKRSAADVGGLAEVVGDLDRLRLEVGQAR